MWPSQTPEFPEYFCEVLLTIWLLIGLMSSQGYRKDQWKDDG